MARQPNGWRFIDTAEGFVSVRFWPYEVLGSSAAAADEGGGPVVASFPSSQASSKPSPRLSVVMESGAIVWESTLLRDLKDRVLEPGERLRGPEERLRGPEISLYSETSGRRRGAPVVHRPRDPLRRSLVVRSRWDLRLRRASTTG